MPTLVNVAFSRVEVSALLMDKYGIDKSRIKIRWRMDLHPRSMGSSLRDVFKWFDTNGDGVISSEEYLDSQERFNDGSRHLTSSKSTGESLVVEGISVYTLNIKGLITRHDIEVTSPTDYPFLEALRELLPVRQGQFSGIPNCFTDPAAAPLLAGAVGVGSAPADAQGRRFSEMTPWLSLAARGAGTAVGEWSEPLLFRVAFHARSRSLSHSTLPYCSHVFWQDRTQVRARMISHCYLALCGRHAVQCGSSWGASRDSTFDVLRAM